MRSVRRSARAITRSRSASTPRSAPPPLPTPLPPLSTPPLSTPHVVPPPPHYLPYQQQMLQQQPVSAEEWSADQERVLAALQNVCISNAEKHRLRYFHLQGYLKYFRIPSIVLAAVISFTAVGLQPYAPQEKISIVTSVLALFCGLINSIELYLQIQSSMETELLSYKDHYMLANEIAKTLLLEPEHRTMEGAAYVDDKFSVFCKLFENAKPRQDKTRDPFRTMDISFGPSPDIVINGSLYRPRRARRSAAADRAPTQRDDHAHHADHDDHADHADHADYADYADDTEDADEGIGAKKLRRAVTASSVATGGSHASSASSASSAGPAAATIETRTPKKKKKKTPTAAGKREERGDDDDVLAAPHNTVSPVALSPAQLHRRIHAGPFGGSTPKSFFPAAPAPAPAVPAASARNKLRGAAAEYSYALSKGNGQLSAVHSLIDTAMEQNDLRAGLLPASPSSSSSSESAESDESAAASSLSAPSERSRSFKRPSPIRTTTTTTTTAFL